jgi:hypothetical protein
VKKALQRAHQALTPVLVAKNANESIHQRLCIHRKETPDPPLEISEEIQKSLMTSFLLLA